MNERRLLLLADALETRIPRDRFNLAQWRMLIDEELDGGEGAAATNEELLTGCGTAGCAIGWACALPEFQAEGLRWNESWPEYGQGLAPPCGWEAVQDFFEIGFEVAELLFADHAYPYADRTNPLAVAARIREFVARAQ